MRVVCYRNLPRGEWSVAEVRGAHGRGKVIAHLPALALANVTFHVSESARQRVVAKRCREVHAWAVGELVDGATTPSPSLPSCPITYNPYRAGTFTMRDGTTSVHRCEYVEFTNRGEAIARGIL